VRLTQLHGVAQRQMCGTSGLILREAATTVLVHQERAMGIHLLIEIAIVPTMSDNGNHTRQHSPQYVHVSYS
jgi:hypothetical protein